MSAPTLIVYQQGQTVANSDALNTLVQWCQNVGQMRAFIALTDMLVYLEGLSTPNDGGQGFFYWTTTNETDDGRNYIIPPGANGSGWVRMGPLLVLPIPVITGMLSAVLDTNAKAVLTSIISALTTLGLVTNGTT